MRISNNLHDEKVELKKGPWTREEDQKLLAYIEENGHGSWRSLPEKAGLERCGKSCRLRWTNYLRPDIRRGKFTSQEDKTIIRLHALLGNRWSAISTHMPKRTDNEIKNYWNTRLKKRLTRMGIDPTTHKPKNDLLKASTQSKEAANLNHMTQWETARLEAEERLVRESSARLRKTIVPQKSRCLDVLKVWQATNNNNRFFSLESPSSTLINFSPNSTTIIPNHNGTVLGEESTQEQVKGKMENWPQENVLLGDLELDYDYNISVPMEFVPIGEFDNCDFDDKMDHWNELLNMVTSPRQSSIV